MKVLLLTGASDKVERALFGALRRRGVDLLLMGEPSAHLMSEAKHADVPFLPLTCRSKIDPKAMAQIAHALRRYGKFDIAHAFTGRTLSNLTLASVFSRLKRIAYRGTVGHLRRLDPTSWMTWLNPSLSRVVCVSGAVKEYLLQQGVPEKRLTIIYKGHDPQWYRPYPRSHLAQFGIPSDAFVIACNANMRPVKGADVLIEATKYFPEGTKIHVLLIGEVRDPALVPLADKHSRHAVFHLPGYRSDAASLVGASDLFIMPSRAREGLPKAALEAMAQGVPTIASAVGGLPELIRHGEDGLLVPPSDPPALASAISDIYLHQELRRKLSQGAKQRVIESFSLERTINSTLHLYERVLSE